MVELRAAPAVHVRNRGFTLLELMIVITVIAIIAAIAIPNLMAARMNANETAAVSVLRTVSTAQAQFRQSARADEDRDSQGEYGMFGELSGFTVVRNTTYKVPTDLTATMGSVDVNGEVHRSGYVFRMYLPAAGGVGTREKPNGGMDAGVLDPDLAETTFACYTWPSRQSGTGTRSFFVNQQAEITHCSSPAYEGSNSAFVLAGSALRTANPDSITAGLAVGTVGADGSFWKSIQ